MAYIEFKPTPTFDMPHAGDVMSVALRDGRELHFLAMADGSIDEHGVFRIEVASDPLNDETPTVET